MKCRTGRPLTFNCPGTIKGWWTRCMYGTSWFATCLHSCLFNLLTYLLWSSASTVVNAAADINNGEGGIEDFRKRPPEHLEGSPADISSISSNSIFPTREPEVEPGSLEEHHLFNHSSSKWSCVAETSMNPLQISAWTLQLPISFTATACHFHLLGAPNFLR